LRLGYQLCNDHLLNGPGALASLARRLEELGLESFWVMDHLLQIEALGPADQPLGEAFTTLAYVAAHTQRMRLGVLVSAITFRSPEWLQSLRHSLEVLSQGRFLLGLGSGWFEREHRAMGVRFGSLSERFGMLEAFLQAHPGPVLVGGMGERRTLPLVARYATACNFFQGEGPRVIEARLRRLDQLCRDIGRNPAEIEKTVLGVFYPGNHREYRRELSRLNNLGIDTAIATLAVPDDPGTLELLAGVGRDLS
jgi:alkanesulfonate monooxygenase SsuD/methylene tetrahydromethanopterin reductase-like flavin-dependent oxidoreductase (luciferase family)